MFEITNQVRHEIEQLAITTDDYQEPICDECYEMGKDDPLGMVSGMNTPTNKKINTIADRIAQDEDPLLRSEARHELVDLFYRCRRSYSDKAHLVDTRVKCFYCHENGDTAMRIRDEGESGMFGKAESEWQ